MKRIFLVLILLIFYFTAFAQEEVVEYELEEEGRRHSISLVISHARIGEGRNAEGNKEFLMVPSIGFDYNYWINEKWAIGLHTDFLNETFFVETPEGEILERERPIAPAIMAGYNIGEKWGVSFGMGREFAGEESFTLTRIKLEYGTEIRKGWEVFGVVSQDFRWSAYNITSFGIGIAKFL